MGKGQQELNRSSLMCALTMSPSLDSSGRVGGAVYAGVTGVRRGLSQTTRTYGCRPYLGNRPTTGVMTY